MTLTDIPFDFASLRAGYAAGLSPVAVAEAALDRTAASGDPGIFIHLADRAALIAEAAALGPFDPARPLWGLPCAVKDNIDVAGMPTTAACPAYAYRPERDASVVARLRQAGALIVGKTNLDQFATGLVGLRTPYPAPRNAIDPRLVPGGSSSGSAVAVARGLVSFALGTDTAGSGRIPAGLNNVVGLKPSFGALSAAGVVPACRTLDCVSVFALTVEDAYAVFAAASGPDPADAYSRAIDLAPLGPRPPVLRVGVPAPADREFFGDGAMAAGYDAGLAVLEALGCRVVELPFGDFNAAGGLLYGGAWVAERYAAIAEFFTANEAALHPITRQIIGGARGLSAATAFKNLYALQALKAKLAPVLAGIDLLCVPTAPAHYSVEDVLAEPIAANSRLGLYTNFVNLLDLCGIAVPAGRRGDGLPMSVTLLAPAGGDGVAAALARDLQAHSALPLGATSWTLPRATKDAAVPADGMIEVAVVGAHLSGMPLNGELRRLGARFCRTARTTAAYRLYALAGQLVPKPGLLRAADGAGESIEAEVWRLAPDALGRFVAAIPPPLGIGTVRLADGTEPKGFLVESAGLRDAVDISHYGSWRRFAAAQR